MDIDQARHNELVQDAAVTRAALAEAEAVFETAEISLRDARARASDAWEALRRFTECAVNEQTSTIESAVAAASVSRIH